MVTQSFQDVKSHYVKKAMKLYIYYTKMQLYAIVIFKNVLETVLSFWWLK